MINFQIVETREEDKTDDVDGPDTINLLEIPEIKEQNKQSLNTKFQGIRPVRQASSRLQMYKSMVGLTGDLFCKSFPVPNRGTQFSPSSYNTGKEQTEGN